MPLRHTLFVGLASALWLPGCDACEPEPRAVPAEPVECESTATAGSPLPGVTPEHETAAYWIARAAERVDVDEPLLGVEAVRDHGARLRGAVEGWPLGVADLIDPIDAEALAAMVGGRLSPMRERLAAGQWVGADGAPVPIHVLSRFDRRGVPELAPQLRVALERVPMRCGPTAVPFYTPSLDHDFDRNLCSTLQAQEMVQLLAPWGDGMILARTRYTFGWIDARSRLSPRLELGQARELLVGPRAHADREVELVTPDGLATARVPAHATLATSRDDTSRAWFATSDGLHLSAPTAGLEPSARPLTRRAFIQSAFGFVGQPYGWGGLAGGRDCSRLVMDVLASFDLVLPRNSAQQARAGTEVIELEATLDEHQRIARIEEAARRGVVLLALPGHIMIYLGTNEAGAPMVIHALAEYARPCAGGGETIVDVGRVVVSDLSLGRGSSRRSLLERLTTLSVFGPSAP